MTREVSLTELISELPPTIDPDKFIAELLRVRFTFATPAPCRLLCRPPESPGRWCDNDG